MGFVRLLGAKGPKFLGIQRKDPNIVFGPNGAYAQLRAEISVTDEVGGLYIYKPKISQIKINSTVDIVVNPLLLCAERLRFPARLEPGEERFIQIQTELSPDFVNNLDWVFRIYSVDNTAKTKHE